MRLGTDTNSVAPLMEGAHARATVDRVGPSKEPVTWRRPSGPEYVGDVALGEGYVRLVGRDPDSNVEVALSIPFAEIETVRTETAGDVVLELSGSQAIRLRKTGVRELSRALAERIRSAANV